MNIEQIRTFLLGLPYVVETLQWGDNLVFWVGDKAEGGKMFALVDLGTNKPLKTVRPVISYAAGAERYGSLLEIEGLMPAPYLARAWWVAAARWDVFRRLEWEEELRAAYSLTFLKLPARTRKLLHASVSDRE